MKTTVNQQKHNILFYSTTILQSMFPSSCVVGISMVVMEFASSWVMTSHVPTRNVASRASPLKKNTLKSVSKRLKDNDIGCPYSLYIMTTIVSSGVMKAMYSLDGSLTHLSHWL